MITRRQARLLGLTGASETADGVTGPTATSSSTGSSGSSGVATSSGSTADSFSTTRRHPPPLSLASPGTRCASGSSYHSASGRRSARFVMTPKTIAVIAHWTTESTTVGSFRYVSSSSLSSVRVSQPDRSSASSGITASSLIKSEHAEDNDSEEEKRTEGMWRQARDTTNNEHFESDERPDMKPFLKLGPRQDTTITASSSSTDTVATTRTSQREHKGNNSSTAASGITTTASTTFISLSSRATTTQLKSAWRGVLRDVTTLDRPKPSTSVASASATGGPSTTTLRLRLRPISSSSVVNGKENTSVPVSGGSGMPRPLPTVLRDMVQRREHIRYLQAQLREGIYYASYRKAHEERLKLLFNCKRDSYSSGDGQQQQFDESAYMKSLDPSRSSKEAEILEVLSAIDTQMNIQFKSVYQLSSSSGGARAAAEQAHEEGSRSSSGKEVKADAAGSASSLLSAPASSLGATERLAAVDAAIRNATRLVPAFDDMLMPYQQEGVRWILQLNLIEHMNGILADDMGLGKTAQTVLYLSCYKTLVEKVIEEPLHVLLQWHRVAFQRSGTAAAAASSLSCLPAAAGKLPLLRQAARRVLDSLPFPLVCVSRSRSSNGDRDFTHNGRCGGDGGASTSSLLLPPRSSSSSSSIMMVVDREDACAEAICRLKQLKKWVLQLSEERAVELLAQQRSFLPTASSRRKAGVKDSAQQHNNSTLQPQDENENVVAKDRASPPPPQPIKRKRGRPSRADQLAAAAAASGTSLTTASSSPSSSTFTSEAHPQAGAGLHLPHTAATTAPSTTEDGEGGHYTASMNEALERPIALRPLLIIAPLSTLPHWRAEFSHFGVSSLLFTVYLINGPRAERDDRVKAFLKHVERLESEAVSAAVGIGRAIWDSDEEEMDSGSSGVQEAGSRPQGWMSNGSRKSLRTEGASPATASATAHSKPERTGLFSSTPVLVIPHDLLVRHLLGVQRHIPSVSWHVVVMDEAQRIKNVRGGLFSKVCALKSISRLVLTGTPLQNNITELFALLQFLAPLSFHTKQQGQLLEQLDEALSEASRSNALEDKELHILLCRRVHRLLAPFILRRDKSVVKAMLPAKKDFAVLCPLLPFQKDRIDELVEKQRAGCLSGNLHIQIRKVLLHPYTMLPYFYIDEDVVRTSGKLLVLDFMMQFLQRTGHKFLVFCSWTLVLDVVETLCGMRGMPYVRLDGRTSVEQREANIRLFNHSHHHSDSEQASGSKCGGASTSSTITGGTTQGSNPCCFLISKAAGGVGLNLQSADTVILLDVDYNPQRDNQALSRVYRVGQKREVRVLRLLIDHEIEHSVLAIHQAKENLDQAVVQAGKYDLHSSAGEREAELHKVFNRVAAGAGQGGTSSTFPTSVFPDGDVDNAQQVVAEHSRGSNGEAGDDDDDDDDDDAGEDDVWMGKGEEGGDVLETSLPWSPTTRQPRASDAAPGSPIFPFGPGGEEDEEEQQHTESYEMNLERPTEGSKKEDWRQRADQETLTTTTISSQCSSDRSSNKEDDSSSPPAMRGSRKRVRRVTFAPEVLAQERGNNDKNVKLADLFLEEEEGGMASEVRQGPSSPTFQSISSSLRSSTRRRLEQKTPPPPPASYILAMKERLKHVLLRGSGEGEAAVLDAMLAEQTRQLREAESELNADSGP